MDNITNECSLDYSGNPAYKPAAIQIAKIIGRVYKENRIGQAGPDYVDIPPIKIHITDKGAVDISHLDADTYTTGMGIALGMLVGIGIGKQKNVTISRKGVSDLAMSPCKATARFESFANLAECANALARGQDEMIDIIALPKQQGLG